LLKKKRKRKERKKRKRGPREGKAGRLVPVSAAAPSSVFETLN
jgi:hypothetical protein